MGDYIVQEEDLQGKADIEEIVKYLKELSNLKYVVSSEGFPLYWSKDLNEDDAEKLTILAIDIYEGLKKSNVLKNSEKFSITLNLKNRLLGILYLENNTIIVISSDKIELINTVLQNISKKIDNNNILCPWCKKDLTLKIFKCPKCGNPLPFGIDKCPYCGLKQPITECPYCKRKINSLPKRIYYTRRKIDVLIGGILTGFGIGLFGAGVFEALSGNNIYLLLLISGSVITWIGINTLRIKTIIEK